MYSNEILSYKMQRHWQPCADYANWSAKKLVSGDAEKLVTDWPRRSEVGNMNKSRSSTCFIKLSAQLK